MGDGFGLDFGRAIRGETSGQDGATEFDGGGREQGEGGGATLSRLLCVVGNHTGFREDFRQFTVGVGFLQC